MGEREPVYKEVPRGEPPKQIGTVEMAGNPDVEIELDMTEEHPLSMLWVDRGKKGLLQIHFNHDGTPLIIVNKDEKYKLPSLPKKYDVFFHGLRRDWLDLDIRVKKGDEVLFTVREVLEYDKKFLKDQILLYSQIKERLQADARKTEEKQRKREEREKNKLDRKVGIVIDFAGNIAQRFSGNPLKAHAVLHGIIARCKELITQEELVKMSDAKLKAFLFEHFKEDYDLGEENN